jgi:hypothetical protein
MKKKSIGLGLGIGVWALAALGCGAQQDSSRENAFLAGVPEAGALQLSITDDATSEALATQDDQVGAAWSSDELGRLSLHLDAPAADGLARPREAVQELNQALRDFLQPIAALVRSAEPDQVTGNVAQWGPVTRGTTEYRFFVRKGLLKRFGWLLQARPEGSSAEFANVAAGGIQVGAVVRRGRGVVGVDLDALADVDPTVHARGKVLAAFAHGPAGTALAYGLHDFARNREHTTPVDAAFQGVHLSGGFNRVRLAFHGNLPETATAAPELVLARVRHHRNNGGRADLLVTGGDIANGKVWLVSECWSAGLASTYRIVRECPGDGIGGARCVEQSSKGEPSACLQELVQPEFPPANAEEPMEDPESPEGDLVPPTEMPSGDAPTDG